MKKLLVWLMASTLLAFGSWACSHSYNAPSSPDVPTATPTPSGSTATFTPTGTPSNTRTITPTPTITVTPTVTPTPSNTATSTTTFTVTDTPTITLTPTVTLTATITYTPTITFTPTVTATAAPVTITVSTASSGLSSTGFIYTAPGVTNSVGGPLNLTANVGDTIILPANSTHPLWFDNGSATCLVTGGTTSGPVTYTFPSTGTYRFHCGNHGSGCGGTGNGNPICGSTTCTAMAGTITVN